MKNLLIITLILSSIISSYAQDLEADDLLNSIQNDEINTDKLLPERMLLTQRAFWGENGIYRKIGIAPKVITNESRERELRVRRTMLKIHQGLGLATAGAMLAQGILGSQLYKGNYAVRNAHESVALGINIAYSTTALMAFAAPPPMVNRKKFDNIKLHKLLSVVHLSGMIGTNVLAHQIENNVKLKPYHRIVAMTTFAAYTAAIISIKLEIK